MITPKDVFSFNRNVWSFKGSRKYKMPNLNLCQLIYMCVYIICIYCLHGYTFLEKHTHRGLLIPLSSFFLGFVNFRKPPKPNPTSSKASTYLQAEAFDRERGAGRRC